MIKYAVISSIELVIGLGERATGIVIEQELLRVLQLVPVLLRGHDVILRAPSELALDLLVTNEVRQRVVVVALRAHSRLHLLHLSHILLLRFDAHLAPLGCEHALGLGRGRAVEGAHSRHVVSHVHCLVRILLHRATVLRRVQVVLNMR